MSLDLTRPEHREALRWACRLAADVPHGAAQVQHFAKGTSGLAWHRLEACRALSSPSQSAAIVRALLEGCGAALPHDGDGDESGFAGEADVRADDGLLVVWVRLDGTWVRRDRAMAQVPALILALLACTDRDGALKALREVGR